VTMEREDGRDGVRVEVCANCGRGSKVEGMDYVEGGVVYCGRNCYWSTVLDASNARLRSKHVRHAANAAARRAALRRSMGGGGGCAGRGVKNSGDTARNGMERNAEQQQHHQHHLQLHETMKDYGHAIYQLDSGLPIENSLSTNPPSVIPNIAA